LPSFWAIRHCSDIQCSQGILGCIATLRTTVLNSERQAKGNFTGGSLLLMFMVFWFVLEFLICCYIGQNLCST